MSVTATLRLALLGLAASMLASACTGEITEPQVRGEPDEECVGSDCEMEVCPDPPCDDTVEPCLDPATCEPPGTQPVLPSESTRFARLTHDQWENTVQDLFHMDTPPGISSSFIGDPSSNGFSTNSEVMLVSSELWLDYQRGAEAVAEMVVNDPELLGRIAPQSGDLAADRDAFLEDFGQRAFRRPMAEGELTRYQRLFDDGSELFGGSAPFLDGVQITLRAMLQSPHFVYRVELSDVAVDDKVRLNGWEVATRLSYSLWNTMPSDELLAAAAAGELDDINGVYTWIQRMLDDPKARNVTRSFHAELLHTDAYLDIDKDTNRYPEYVSESGAYMKEEVELFVEDVIFEQDGTWGDVLTSNTTFVNGNLADIYGLEGDYPADEFQRVELDPTQRSGLLTRLGFLAKNATALEHDPIHRGVFVSLDIACANLDPPPDNVPPIPPNSGETVREKVENHTGLGTCGEGCHSVQINPAGFPFENYDALGRYQLLDNGYDVDASGAYLLDGEFQDYQNAVDFSAHLARSHQVHACYAGHWLEYVYGRRLTNRDTPIVNGLAEASVSGDVSVRDMIAALLLSDAFLTRTP